jgi:hypothetical protein
MSYVVGRKNRKRRCLNINNFIKAGYILVIMSSEANAISKLKKLLESNCVIEKVQPPVMASDAEVNIVIVTLLCPDGKKETLKAYREEAVAMREFIRTHQ